MKILFATHNFHPKFYFWSKTFSSKGDNLCFFLLTPLSSNINKNDVSVKIFKKSLTSRVIGKIIKFKKIPEKYFSCPNSFVLYKEIKNFNPDVIIVKDWKRLYSIQFFVIAKILRKKIILYHLHAGYVKNCNLYKINTNKIKKNHFLYKVLLFSRLLPKTQFSPIIGKKYKSKQRTIYYLPFPYNPGIDLKKKKYFKNNKINIISVGKLNQERKNNLLLLKVINDIKKRFSIHLTLVGSLPKEKHKRKTYQKLLKYIKDNELESIVTIKSNLPFLGVQKEYLNNDLFVLPSINENIGIVVLEAMSHGLPVICTDTCGAKIYIENNQNSLICISDNKEDLKNKILFTIKNKDNLKKVGRKNFELVKNNHSPEQFYKNFLEIVNNAKQ